MHITWSTYVVPVITWIFGLVASILVVWFTSRSTQRREHELKAIERTEARIIRRNEFQRQSLLELQEVSRLLVEAATQIYDFRLSKTLTDTLPEYLPPNLGQGHFEADGRASIVQARIRNNDVRNKMFDLKRYCDDVRSLKKQSDAEAVFEKLILSFHALNEMIGEDLRLLDAVDEQVG